MSRSLFPPSSGSTDWRGWGAARGVLEKIMPEQRGVQLQQTAQRSHCLPSHRTPSPISQKTSSCNCLDDGKMGLEQVNGPAQLVHCVQVELGMFPKL